MHKLNRHAFLYATTQFFRRQIRTGNPTNDEMVAKALHSNLAQMQEFQLAVGVVERLGRNSFKVLKRTRRLSWTTSAISATILADMMGFEAPHRLIEFFGDNPDRAKRLAVMSPGRRRAELARVESQLVPDAGDNVGAEPSWLRQAKSGTKSMDLNDPRITDLDFERAFKKRFYTDKAFDRSKFGR